MASLRITCALALLAACGPNVSTDYDTFPEPVTVAGPPGGEIDPGWGAQPGYADPGGYPDGYADTTYDQNVEPSSDPNDAGYVMGAVTDDEINSTLAGKGEWVWSDEYGWIWRPYATEVGVDFTPYETAGSWVWTDWGWTYASDWDWGWLAFHYGRWGWYDDYWAWQPDYEWSPAWCEWRSGGGYVGWRPLGPTIRDHRGEHAGPTFHDHRTGQGPQIRDHRTHHAMDSHWRFTKSNDFGKRIRPNLVRTPAEGLRVTSTVARPPVRANYQPVHVASLMRGRLALRESMANASGVRVPAVSAGSPPPYSGVRNPSSNAGNSAPGRREFGGPRGVAGSDPAVWAPGRQQYPTYRPQRPSRPSTTITQPGYNTPDRDPAPTQPTHTRPNIDDHPSRPDFDRGQPSQPTWTPEPHPQPSFGDRPSRPDRAQPAQPTWTPPSRPRPSFDDHPTYSPPARDSRPSGNWSPPSRPSSPPSSSTWSPPPRPSSPPPSSSSSSSSGSWGSSRGSSSSSSSSSGSWGGSRGSSSSSSSSSSGSSHSSGGSWGGSRGSSGGGGGGGGWGGGARSHRR